VAEVEPGGYLFYDSTKPLPPSKFREDINVIGMPLMEICNQAYSDPRQRQLFKNIIYVGALAALLDVDIAECEKLIGEQYKGKEKLLEPNIKALHMGRDYARDHLEPPAIKVRPLQRRRQPRLHRGQRCRGAGLRLWRRHRRGVVSDHAVVVARRGVLEALPQVQDRSGHQEGALRRGAGRRRTGLHRRRDRRRMERRARIHVHFGSGHLAHAGIHRALPISPRFPAVIIDVQRAGPSTGMPTRTQQSDLLSCAYASHGDTKHVLLFPEDPNEAFQFCAQAFDLADRLQTPIFVLTDLDIGMNDRLCEPLKWDDSRRYDRGKVLSYADLEAGKRFGRYLDVDADGITWRTYPGTHPKRGSFFTRGTSRDRYARYTEEGSAYVDNMQRLLKKFETAKDYVPKPVVRQAPKPSRFGVIYYGSTSPAMDEALAMLDEESMQVDAMRVRAFPFHDVVLDFDHHHEHVFVVEAEPRRAAANAARHRGHDRSRQAHARTALRRHADHGPLHHGEIFTAAESVQRDAHEAHGCWQR
jgi:2-oxoglutarate ferredoxin oxidoreductase subunit alpha